MMDHPSPRREARWTLLWAVLACTLAARAAAGAQYVINVTLDGVGSGYLDQLINTNQLPNFRRLQAEGAWTSNARTDHDLTETLPSHTTMITGRGLVGADGHNWSQDYTPTPSQTLHNNKGSYVASVFDVAHDNGLRTGLFAGKSKFVLFPQSYGATTGAPDATPPDNGRNKIDTYLYDSTSALFDSYLSAMAATPMQYSFLHLLMPDSAGHSYGWGGAAFNQSIREMDLYVGRLMSAVENSPVLRGNTAIIITADHGGTGNNHPTYTDPLNYTVPFYVWGPGVTQGADLYALNPATRQDPGASRIPFGSVPQPIRNGDIANLSLNLLGLGPIPGSTINSRQDLAVQGAAAPRPVLLARNYFLQSPGGVATWTPGLSDLELGFTTTWTAQAGTPSVGTTSSTTPYRFHVQNVAAETTFAPVDLRQCQGASVSVDLMIGSATYAAGNYFRAVLTNGTETITLADLQSAALNSQPKGAWIRLSASVPAAWTTATLKVLGLANGGGAFDVDNVEFRAASAPQPVLPVNAFWRPAGAGSWADANNWTNGVPSQPGDSALLGPSAASATVTLDGTHTLANLTLNNSRGYRLSGPNDVLIMANGAGPALIAVNGTAAAHEIAVAVRLDSDLNVNVPSAATLTMSNSVMGDKGLNVGGDGTVVLSAVNAHAGGTTVTAGTLKLSGGDDRLPPAGALTVSGGTLDVDGNRQSLAGPVSFQGNAVVRNGTLMKSGADYDAQGGTVSATLAGFAGLTKSGSGTLTLSAQNTYSGGTTVMVGTLALSGGDDRLLPSGPLTILGGTLSLGSRTQHASSAVSFQGGTVRSGTLVKSGSDYDGRSGTVSAVLAGNVGLTKSGTGTLVLSGNNTYTGPTLLAAGTLSVSSDANLGKAGGVLTFAGGTLQVTGTALTSLDARQVNWDGFHGGIDVADPANTFTIQQALAGSGALSKAGEGTLVLTAGNAHTGGTTVAGGTLRLSGGDDRLAPAGALTVAGGTLDLDGGVQHLSGLVLVQGGSVQNGTLVKTGADYDTQAGTIAAALAGDVGLRQSGPNTTVLANANTYSGGTTLAAGTLSISDDNNLGAPGTALTFSGGLLQVTGNTMQNLNNRPVNWATFDGGFDVAAAGHTLTITQDVAGNGALSKAGPGTLVLSGKNSYSGGTTVTAGTLLASGGDERLGTGGLTIVGSAVLDLGGGNQHASGTVSFQGGTVQNGSLITTGNYDAQSGTVAAVLAGSAGLSKSGSGTLSLSAANTYAGGTSIAAGTVMLSGGDDRLPTSGALAMTGGVLDLGGGNQHVAGAVSLQDATVQNGTLTKSGSDYDVQSGTVSAVLAGAVGLTKSGSGLLTLSAANTYNGGTTLAGGTLSVAGDANLGEAGAGLTFSGGVLQVTGATLRNLDSRTVNWSTLNGGFDIASSGNTFTVTQNIAGNGSLSKAGPGALVLAGDNSYAGGTMLTAGTLSIASDANLGGPGAGLTISGGVLQVTGTALANLDGRPVNWSTFNGGLDVADAGNTFTVSQDIAGSGQFTKSGSGSLVLSGACTHTGGITLGAGTLRTSGGDDRLPTAGPLTLLAGTLDLGGNTQHASGVVSLLGATVSNGTLIKTGADYDGQSGAVSAVLAGAAGLTKSSGGTLVLSGANTYAGSTTITSGTLKTTGGDDRLPTAGSLVLTYGTLDLGGTTQHISGAVSFRGSTVQNGTLVKTGADYDASSGIVSAALAGTAGLTISSGSLTLSGSNTYTGGTTITGGTLYLSGADDRLPPAGNLTVSGPGYLGLGGKNHHLSGAVSFRDSAYMNNGTLTKTGADYDAQAGTIAAVLAGAAGLTKSSGGTLTLSGTNTYTGGTMLAGGTLAVSSNNNLGASGGGLTFAGGVLRVSGGILKNLDARTVNWGAFNGGFDIYTSGTTFTVSQAIAGSGALSKAGPGILVLSGNNSYTGGTVVTAGALKLVGDDRLAPTGALTISGGVLDLGNGTQHVSGLVSIAGGGVQNGTLIADGPACDAQSGAVSAVLAGTAGLTKSGSGMVTLTGVNAYTGPTTLAGGTLSVANDANLGAAGANLVFSGGVLQVTGASIANLDGRTVNWDSFNGGFDIATSGATFTVSQAIAGIGALSKAGAGVLLLAGSNTYTGGTTVSKGTLRLSGGDDRLAAAGLVNITGGTLDLGGATQHLSGPFSLQSGTVTSGTLIKTGADYDLRSGTVQAALAGTAGLTKSGTGTVTLSTIAYSGSTTITAGTLVLPAGDDSLPAASPLTVTGGTLDLNAGVQHVSGPVTLQGSAVVSNGTLSKNGADYDAQGGTISAVLAGTAGLTKSGPGTVTLSGANTYAGPTTVTAGLLRLSAGEDRLPTSSPLTVSGGTLDLNGWNQHTTATVSVQSGAVQNGTLINTGADYDAQSGAISAGLAGSAGLIKSGDGVLTLSGTNTYAGGTLVHQGTLQISNGRAVPPGTVLTIDAGASVVFSNGIIGTSSSAGAAASPVSPGIAPAAVPEPGTLLLFVVGAAAMIAVAVRRQGGWG
jgi:autotransporter-associated beta strand protein